MKPQTLNSGQHFFLALLGAATCQLAISAPAYASCGAAFCSVNSDWNASGIACEPGMRSGLRCEYIEQNQLRFGTGRTAPLNLPETHGGISTYNRTVLANIDHTASSGCGIAVQLPLLNHAHIHVHNGPATGPETENLTNADGERAGRSLQPGNGSTDLIAGAYCRDRMLASATGWFAQGLWQRAVATRDDYRPGDRFAIDVGINYPAGPRLGLLRQLNAAIKSRDSGANAEPDRSGGKVVNLSPGLRYAGSKSTQIYSFIQKPVYQDVNGIQLTAGWPAVIGIGYRL